MQHGSPLDDPRNYDGMTLESLRTRTLRACVKGALARTRSLTAASRELDISRSYLYDLIAKLEITTPGRDGRVIND